MELRNDFRVGVPVSTAWDVLTDLERIAPCMPGAELQEVEGEEYRGVVKVKVGPITAQYKGSARFVEQDRDAHRAVLRAEGRDTRGQGNANATITAALRPDGDGTAVEIVTDLAVTGKVAQFGRGVLADVSGKLLTQFVSCLETSVLAGIATGAADAPGAEEGSPAPGLVPEALDDGPATVTSEPAVSAAAANGSAPPATFDAPQGGADGAPERSAGPRTISATPAAPVDLLDALGGSLLKRVAPAVLGLLATLWLLRRRRR